MRKKDVATTGEVSAGAPVLGPAEPGQDRRYRAVLADPPWRAQQRGRYGAGRHYLLMSDARILGLGSALRQIMAAQSFCFLWVTTATVPLGLKVLEAWGFRYTSFYFWAKPRYTMGHTFRNAGELLLLGVRGSGTTVAFRGQPNWGLHPLQEHSHKPEEMHQIVERLVGAGPYLELFARRPAPSGGDWDVWGDQVVSTVSLAAWGYPVPSDRAGAVAAEARS